VIRVLVYGENWEGTHARLLQREFLARGHDVLVFDYTKSLIFGDASSLPARAARKAARLVSRRLINRQFLAVARASRPGLVVISKGLDLYPSTITALRSLGAFVLHWSPDDYCNPRNSSRPLLASMRHFDLIVSPRPVRFERYRELGARDLLYIDWYYSPEIHFPVPSEILYNAAFVGSWSRARERFLGAVESPIHIFGGGWQKASKGSLGRHRVHPLVLGPTDYRQVICSSRFNLNLFTAENFDTTNQRMFEVPACNGLLVSERSNAANDFFGDRKGYLAFSTTAELDSILESSLDFSSVRAEGRAAVVGGYTSFAERFQILYEAAKTRLTLS
jgi:spore maturation protein CgeB